MQRLASTAVIWPNVAERPPADNWDTEGPVCSLLDGHRGLNEPCSETAVRKPSDLTVSVHTQRGINNRLKFKK